MNGPVPARTYRLVLYHEAMSPVTHMKGSEGNTSLVFRQEVVTPAGVRGIAAISGNALRHREIRAAGARWLIGEYGLAGRLTLPQLNFLCHGGALTEGGGREDTARIAEMQRVLPLVRVLGGCLPDQVLAGSCLCGFGVLVCAENRRALEFLLGDAADCLPPRLRPGESFISGYQYTRGDARKAGLAPAARIALGPDRDDARFASLAGRADPAHAACLDDLKTSSEGVLTVPLDRARAMHDWYLAHRPGPGEGEPPGTPPPDLLRFEGPVDESDSNLMIFTGQAVTRGAAFVQEIVLPHVARAEFGALLHALGCWQSAGGTVGGQGARGHGRLATSAVGGDAADHANAVAHYVAHARSVREDAVAWLDAAFARRPARAEGKAASTAPAPAGT